MFPPLAVALLLAVGLTTTSCGVAPIDPALASHQQMLRVLDAIEARADAENPYLGTGPLTALQRALAATSPESPVVRVAELHLEIGRALLRLGREGEAVASLSRAQEVLAAAGSRAPAVDFALGVAYLRVGETQNCCQRNTPDSCLLPIRGGGVHTDRRGSTQAMEQFRRVLQQVKPGSPLYHQSIWLWNLAAMTLGDYPKAVPARFRIPTGAFAAKADFPHFPNVAKERGVDTLSQLGGAVAEDFDGDGRLDLMVSDWAPSGQLRLFRNDPEGFIEVTGPAGLTGIRGGINLIHADYDNDGDADVFVLRGGWFGRSGRHPNSLLRNDGGVFVDVTFAAGMGEVALPTQTGAWADYDNDGDVDLFVGNEPVGRVASPCNLFRNNGDGTFTDVAVAAGVTNGRFTKAVVWGDYDNDGDPDLFLSNMNAANRLYRNEGDGTFVDVAPALGVVEPRASFPAWFFDFNNDGNLDLFVSSYEGGIADVCAALLGSRRPFGRPRLYRGDGKGGFVDVAEEAQLHRPMLPMGCNFGDLDNDGFLDFYLGTGWPMYAELMPSLMFRNRGGKTFEDVTIEGGFGNLQKGHGVAFADFDNDGDQDVFEQMGGAYRGDRYFDCLYENPGFGHHWLGLRLVGTTSNRSGIGARIRVDVVIDGERRSMHRTVNSGGSFGAQSFRQVVGLGAAAKIERLTVFWPTTGRTQEFVDVPVDGYWRLTEGRAALEPETGARAGR